ncbi:hypothetical protein VB796_21585 [Arcicella sp. LKC2W]|uniref:hypothetical protein n=1 Tax=Arcicella sp. LKC2W TaxID=2984198 RepID=UPI002B1E9412|nr:hypothetical protein [Arcicella sp. LKC2W]MEA5461675.1 hypothetical protein [Arcicella sp. LKC2W]
MKNYILILFLFTFNKSYSQCSFRIKTLDFKNGSIDFILPPKSNLVLNEKGVFRKNLRYHSIEVENLNSNYYVSLSQLDKAIYCHTKKTKILDSKEGNISTVTSFCRIQWKNSGFILEIDYNDFLDKSPDSIKKLFEDLSKKLLVEFAKKEVQNTWATSICQNIIEKIFEVIPIPEEASLARYISEYDVSYGHSFILLNSKIKLRVDAVDIDTAINGNWSYRLIGTSMISIYRDKWGRIIQNPFHNFQNKGMPDNLINNDGKIVLQASTEDIQLSNTLKECDYIFLYQNNLKKNNKSSSPGGCNSSSETSTVNCNSQLWHFKKNSISQFYLNDDLNFSSVNYISSFGLRNVIYPLIEIVVNNKYVSIPIGINFNQLKPQLSITNSTNIFRYWNGKYKKINLRNESILLPSDKIQF